MSWSKENLFILRLPKDHADRVREAIKSEAPRDRLKIEFYSGQRHVKVQFDEEELSGKLVDLPAIIECHKTLDKKTLYKTGDISQMVVCSAEVLNVPEERLDELPLSKRKEMAKKFTWTHGITPPLKNIRKRRFRKTAPKKFIDSPEIEKELKRLLREDLQAVNLPAYKVISDEGRQEDAQSVVSENTSRAQTPALPQDDESMISNFNDDAAKSELLRVLEEASSSSEEEGEEGDEEEEEIAVEDSDDEASRNPEVFRLHQAIQDLEMQIEEQKMKIESTVNPLLRSRFETFLLELERHRQEKLDELQNITN